MAAGSERGRRRQEHHHTFFLRWEKGPASDLEDENLAVVDMNQAGGEDSSGK